MLNVQLKNFVSRRILPRVQQPAQYAGGELNMVRKDHRTVRGKLCMAFPDMYTIGMSHHGLQVLYSLMNAKADWVCERAFTPGEDMEQALRETATPLYSLETFTPLDQFDVFGFTLQYEICTSNILTMLDLGRIPLRSVDRTMEHPLIIAGGPCAQNPEPIAPFIDLFVTGDGEPSLPRICEEWLRLKDECRTSGVPLASSVALASAVGQCKSGVPLASEVGQCERAGDEEPAKEPQPSGARVGPGSDINDATSTRLPTLADCAGQCHTNNSSSEFATGEAGRRQREAMLARMAATLPFAYVPRFYEPEFLADGRMATLNRTRPDVPETIEPSILDDFEATPIPSAPVVPYIECVHDRISVEIMRGCPWQCRFCQSTVIKRPLRIRAVETIVQGALEQYRNTGFNEISLLSLSTSDYPHFEQLVRRMRDVFGPLGVNISVPSLRVNEILKSVAALVGTDRHTGLTLAPEVARDDMREQIRKKIKNEDLYEGCKAAFAAGFDKVKLYFMCGLPGERQVDLDGIVDMAETIARIGREVRGRFVKVTASVSNFVPKAHTPYQWNGMQRREYFHWAHQYLRARVKIRSVQVKCHPVETSMLEGLLSRGDRRLADVIELAWRRGARLDSWGEKLNAPLWWQALADVAEKHSGLDFESIVHKPYQLGDRLPWDHINVKKGRTYLEKEQVRSIVQLEAMAGAV